MANVIDFFVCKTGDSTESGVSIGSEMAIIGAGNSQHDHLSKAEGDCFREVYPGQIGSVSKQIEEIMNKMQWGLEFSLYELTRLIELILFVE